MIAFLVDFVKSRVDNGKGLANGKGTVARLEEITVAEEQG
jgi:hypothetical protein